jgi:hypothetical protein
MSSLLCIATKRFVLSGEFMNHTARRSMLLFLSLFCLMACLCVSCGYHLAADSPSVIGDGSKTLKVKGVDYPTLQPWLPYIIRSNLRDEINARHIARWVDSGPADYEIQIKVIAFTSREWMRSSVDATLLFAPSMTLEAIIYKGDTNKEVWRSGLISYSDHMENPDEKSGGDELLTQIVRMLADKMRSAF